MAHPINPTSCSTGLAKQDLLSNSVLSQARGSRCLAATNANRHLFVVVSFLHVSFVPGAILVAVAVGRFADNRSPPKSRRAKAVSICWKAPSIRLLVGTKVASDPRQRQENTEGTLALFLELESERATRW